MAKRQSHIKLPKNNVRVSKKMRSFLRFLSFLIFFNENSLEKVAIFPKTPLKKLFKVVTLPLYMAFLLTEV